MPYLEALISRMLLLLQSSDPEAQHVALSVIASAAASATSAFQPYAEAVLPLLGRYMQARTSFLLTWALRMAASPLHSGIEDVQRLRLDPSVCIIC